MAATTTRASAGGQTAYDALAERGMVAQCTEPPEAIAARLSRPVTVYNGFDPTADSLHVGHLVPALALRRLREAGHKVIAVVGGATALVGDPSGKSEARKLLTAEQVAANARAIGDQLEHIVGGDVLMRDNADWLVSKGWIEMLREVGPHFSVNRMLTMDSVKGRMTPGSGTDGGPAGSGGGISFLEFNYMVMQAYDFLHLYREQGCTLQTGGQDQWGNIVMGLELIRRLSAEPASAGGSGGGSATHGAKPQAALAAGLTYPLVTKADGGKFGKTEAGAVWLSAERTSPYDFYQFFRNTADADVGRYLAYFTLLPMTQVDELAAAEGPALNDAKEVLAHEVTRLIHGDGEADKARDSARKAFGAAKDVTGDAIPSDTLAGDELTAGIGLLDLMRRAGLAKSNGEARRLVQGGGVRLHDDKVTDPQRTVTDADVADGYVLLRAGKKRLFRFDVR